jgi:protein TonB
MKKLCACPLALALALAVAGCSTNPDTSQSTPAAAVSSQSAGLPPALATPVAPGNSVTDNINSYKVDLAHRISHVNAARVYEGRPQALLRSVIVLRYSVDRHGNLVHSEVLRSNRDRATEAAALASLKSAAPFPRPASHLLKHGRVDVSESWLFNSDGRFQLRSIAQAQMTE